MRIRNNFRRMLTLIGIMVIALASLVPTMNTRSASAATAITLTTIADAGTIKSQPTFTGPNSYLVLSNRGNGDFDNNFIKFNLSAIPTNATINSAELHLNIIAAGGSLNVATGRANGAWTEATLNWNNQPTITWNAATHTISALGDSSHSVTGMVRRWHNGTDPNYGLVLRGTNSTGGVFADSAESGVAPKLVVTYTMPPDRSRDLGDAPDSTNHAGVAMAAYGGVQARFPTVFDPATGAPPGPLHADPLPFHLGSQVSREVEADVGPDEDPVNNIRPAANLSDGDRFDDGSNPNAWNLAHCARATLPTKVFISPQAVNWFRDQNKKGYLNIWLDSNRDGDWGDAFSCAASPGVVRPTVEHILIDAPVDVVALGAGVHTLQPVSGFITFPAALAAYSRWVRVTLSENPSNKPLQFGGIKYGDGRGFAAPFRTGETEDYRRVSSTAAGDAVAPE